MIDNACQCISELDILADIPVEAWIHRLATWVHEAREEMTKVQLELNLQITELRLKAQLSTASEVREQWASTIIMRLEEIRGAVRDSTSMLEESLEVLITSQEDPNIQRLETKA